MCIADPAATVSKLLSGLFFLALSISTDMEVKPINKRASGQAFEVILKPLSPVSDCTPTFNTSPKRDISLEDIEKKLEAAEDRRMVGPVAFQTGCRLPLLGFIQAVLFSSLLLTNSTM